MMRKLFLTLGFLWFAGTSIAHNIDSLYDTYLISKGEQALQIANEIMEMADDTNRFSRETSRQVMNGMLTKTLLYWHYDRSEMFEVINYANKAIEFHTQRDELDGVAACYNMIGIAYQRMGRFKEAIENYDKCIELTKKLDEQGDDPFYQLSIRYTTNNLAAIYCSMGELDMAEEMFGNCIDMMEELNDDYDYQDMAVYLQNLADIYLLKSEDLQGQAKLELIDKAVNLSERALDYSVNHGDKPNKVIQRMMVVSRSYYAQGRVEDANKMIDEAMQMAVNEEDSFLQAEIEIIKGKFLYGFQYYKESETHFQHAIALSKAGRYEECLLNAYKGASDAARQYDLNKAMDYLEQTVVLKDSIFNENQQKLIRDYQVKYALAEKEHKLEIQGETNKRQTQGIIFLSVLAGLLIIILFILTRLVRSNQKRNETLERLNETQNRILSVASHDVKTSVLAQNMVLKLVNEHFDMMGRDELKEKVTMLKMSSDELKDKLYTIIHWINGELGKAAVSPESFNLASVIKANIRLHEEELKVKELKTAVDIPSDLMCYDQVNVINIVFQNLFSNAIKFSETGDEIKVRAFEEGGKLWVEVSDNGIGISSNRLQELMHDTVKSALGTKGERGTGIGLFVSRQLMVKNGGQLLIESVEGQGTRIRFNVKKAKQ